MNRFKTVAPEFKKHIQLLTEMKKDLEYIFKKVRTIKTKLAAQYPDAMAEAVRSSFAEECEEEQDNSKKNTENRRSLHIKTENVDSGNASRRASE